MVMDEWFNLKVKIWITILSQEISIFSVTFDNLYPQTSIYMTLLVNKDIHSYDNYFVQVVEQINH